MINQEYFVIESGGSNNYPLLEWADGEDLYGPLARSAAKGVPLPIDRSLKLRLGAPVPAKPEMVDYHELPEPVVGERIKNLLEAMAIYGTQLIPANIPVEDEIYHYWLLHVFNEISCLDKDKSICAYSKRGRVIDIKKLVLDENILQEIPLEKRLIFVLRESTSTYLFHRSIKEAIMSLDPAPKGIQFFCADSWGSDAVFR